MRSFLLLVAVLGCGGSSAGRTPDHPPPVVAAEPVPVVEPPRAPPPPPPPPEPPPEQVALDDSATGDPCDGGEIGRRGKAGGGGSGVGTTGLGRIGTIGHGSGSGTGQGYGSGRGQLGGKSTSPKVVEGQTTVEGDIDRNVIRRVVRRNMGRIRLCYERELAKDLKLAAKVVVKFTIAVDGKVTQATATSTEGGNAALELCLAKAFETMQFPPRGGGGVVTVVYPFRFAPPPANL